MPLRNVLSNFVEQSLRNFVGFPVMNHSKLSWDGELISMGSVPIDCFLVGGSGTFLVLRFFGFSGSFSPPLLCEFTSISLWTISALSFNFSILFDFFILEKIFRNPDFAFLVVERSSKVVLTSPFASATQNSLSWPFWRSDTDFARLKLIFES